MTKKRYVVRHDGSDSSDRYFHQQHFATNQKSTTSGSKVMAQTVVLMTLTFVLLIVTQGRYEVLESPCEFS